MSKMALTSLLFTITLLPIGALGAPHNGDPHHLRQPDGTLVPVWVWGDEFYQRVETAEGYTLIREEASEWIVFAKLSADGNRLVSAGIRYTGPKSTEKATRIGLARRVDIPAAVKRSIAGMRRQHIAPGPRTIDNRPRPRVVGDLAGVTVLVDFSDEPATVPAYQIEQLMNGTETHYYGNRSSVREYYAEMSGGRLNYTNVVVDYYRAKRPKTFYDSGSKDFDMEQAKFLIWEALDDLDKKGFDFSGLTLVEDDVIMAINCLYAGNPSLGWSRGLWPHQGNMDSFRADGVRSGNYQLTNIGKFLSIQTICHENGHMIADYKDLYDYGNDSGGVGQFCLMSGSIGSDIAPIPINAYYRYISGWEDVVDITDALPGTIFSAPANANSSFIYRNVDDSAEFFVIDPSYPQGSALGQAGHGLFIWHIDENQNSDINKNGNNNNAQDMTPDRHYYVSFEQADGAFEMENNVNLGAPSDPFFQGNADEFSDTTTPDANWWDGSPSGLHIGNISPIAKTMYFTIGTEPLTFYSAGGKVQGLRNTYSTLNYKGAYQGSVPIESDGTFNVDGLIEGTYQFQAKSHHYYSNVVEVTVGPDQTDIQLSIQMPEIEVDTTPLFFTVNEDEPVGTAQFAITNPGAGTLSYASSVYTASNDIVINEVYTSPTLPSDGVELWNRGQNLNLGGWKLILNHENGLKRTYTFPSGYVVKAGKTMVVKDDDNVGQGINFLYLGFSLDWRYTNNTVFSVTLVDGLGNGVDFFKTLGSADEPPHGTTWTGDGVELLGRSNARIQNEDNNSAADWISDANITVNRLNAGQTEVSVEEQNSWLSILPAADTIEPDATKNVTIQAVGADFPADTVVSDTVYILHNVPDGGPPFEIDCEMTVEPGALMDAGSDSDSDADSDSDSDSDSDTDTDSPPPPSKKDDGCGCAAAGSKSHRLLKWGTILHNLFG